MQTLKRGRKLAVEVEEEDEEVIEEEKEEEKETKVGKDTNEEKEAKRDKGKKPAVDVEEEEEEEEKETKDSKDGNWEKEANGNSEIEDKIHGLEVHISGIPTDATEEEIKEFCKDSGEVVKVKIVRKNDDKEVYTFVSFRTVEMASEAIKELHNSEFKGKKVKCSMSFSSKRESEKHAELLSKPRHGSEVKIGGIPTDATKEELKEFCKDSGEVVEVRMYRKKQCAYVSFRKVDMASEAIKELHNSEFKGKKVSCDRYLKNTILIGNIPREWAESDLKNAVKQAACPGVTHVDLMKDSSTGLSLGFGFVDYYNRACANYALRRKLPKLDFKLDSNSPTIRWADPWVRMVYVENIPKDVTDEQIKKLFERHGDIENVVLPPPKAGDEKRCAFVHFRERANAMKALQNTERYELKGEVLERSLPEPGATMHGGPPIVMPSYSFWPPYGMSNVFLPPTYWTPSVMAPPGMAMVPVVLPDGRLVYYMQQTAAGSSPQWQ